jgi:hypothetical protein
LGCGAEPASRRVTDADTGEYLSSGPFRQVRRRLDDALFNEVVVPTLPLLMWVGAARLSAVMVTESSFRRQLMHTPTALAGGP